MRRNESAPFRVSITGIDGAGKDTITRSALTRSASDGLSIVKIGRPAYIIGPDGSTSQIFKRTTEAFDKLHRGADVLHSRLGISALNVVRYATQARILEPIMARRQPAPDITAWVRDPRIDTAVYFEYYLSSLRRRVTVAERLKAMQLLTGFQRDLIIVLNVDPEVAVERIDARITKEREAEAADGFRGKWRHMHENVDSLAGLAAAYSPVLAELQKMAPTRIVEIDTTARSQEDVAHLAYTTIREAMDRSIPSPTHISI